MIYFEIDNAETAAKLSSICFQLFSKKNAEYDTNKLFSFCGNKNNEKVLAFFNENAVVARQYRGDLSQLLDELGALLHGLMSQNEAQQIAFYITNNDKLTIINIIPEYFKQNAITKEQAMQLGYFQEPFNEQKVV